jgi:hypothetical protein
MKFPEKYYKGFLSSITGQIVNCFKIPFKGTMLTVVASNIKNFEHASVSLKHRNPTWNEMCFVKDLFWEDEECCIQFHPRKSEYVNLHEHCLHIWKLPEEVMTLLESYKFDGMTL